MKKHGLDVKALDVKALDVRARENLSHITTLRTRCKTRDFANGFISRLKVQVTRITVCASARKPVGS